GATAGRTRGDGKPAGDDGGPGGACAGAWTSEVAGGVVRPFVGCDAGGGSAGGACLVGPGSAAFEGGMDTVDAGGSAGWVGVDGRSARVDWGAGSGSGSGAA